MKTVRAKDVIDTMGVFDYDFWKQQTAYLHDKQAIARLMHQTERIIGYRYRTETLLKKNQNESIS